MLWPISPNSMETECCGDYCRWLNSMPHHWRHRNPPPVCTDGGSGGSNGADCDDGVPGGAAATSAGVWPAGGSRRAQDSKEIGSDRSRCPHSSCYHRNRKLEVKKDFGVRKIQVQKFQMVKICQ